MVKGSFDSRKCFWDVTACNRYYTYLTHHPLDEAPDPWRHWIHTT